MPGSTTLATVGQVIATLAITTSEDTYTFNFGAGAKGARAAVQLVADQNWLYSHKTAGPFFPVGANVPFDLSAISVAKVIYVKAATTSGTLYGVVKDVPVASIATNS